MDALGISIHPITRPQVARRMREQRHLHFVTTLDIVEGSVHFLTGESQRPSREQKRPSCQMMFCFVTGGGGRSFFLHAAVSANTTS